MTTCAEARIFGVEKGSQPFWAKRNSESYLHEEFDMNQSSLWTFGLIASME